MDMAAIRAKLNTAKGQQYWRSLEELVSTPEFESLLHREFPAGASEWWDGLSRRSFLKMAAASLALAGVTACTKQPAQEILPYVKQPAELVLGEPLFYATAMVQGGFARGILVKSLEGHPIKVDGNPQHPASLGGSNVWMQSSILDLYDPDRSQAVTHNGEISTWASFLADLNELLTGHRTGKGKGLRFLTETVTSPTLAKQLNDLLLKFPQARWVQYDPITRDNVREGARLAFGEFVEAHYEFDKAKVILALDSDFLYSHPESLRYARKFADSRRLSHGSKEMNRLYVVESTPTVTGAMADHRYPFRSGAIENFTRALAHKIGVLDQPPTAMPPDTTRWMEVLSPELQKNRGASIVIAGEWQPPWVHALAHLLNETLGNVGKTVFYAESAEARPVNQLESLRDLVQEAKAGLVETLFILGANPAFTAPADLEFGPGLERVQRSIHLGLEMDETARLCSWHIPQAHYLESWGDARAFDGTVSLIQPLITPLYDGKSSYELLGALVQQQPIRSDYEIVRDYWRDQRLWPDFESGWRQALHDGFIEGTQNRRKEVRVREDFKFRTGQLAFEGLSHGQTREGTKPSPPSMNSPMGVPAPISPGPKPDHGKFRELLETDVELCFRPDPNLWDGRFANNGWLQECPKPISKLTWDNAACISPAIAERHRLATNDVIEIEFAGITLRAPIWVTPGQAERSILLPFGGGRSSVGRVGQGVGFNAYTLRVSDHLWFGSGARVFRTGERHLLVGTQTHQAIDSPERQVYRDGVLQDYLKQPDFIRNSIEKPGLNETLYQPKEFAYEGPQWGMSIDLTSCIGCNACVVACEVENNIPVVGKDQVHRNREMLWLRVDTYYQGSLDNPQFNHMPVPCMHCEHAPCELVCPVEATVHDHEGLNLQVYNRCVGTRFCSNNCPYKVRRFNFFHYAKYDLPNYKPMYNPEVTVRWRGVMEKCTYCVQRIAAARITAEKEGRRIRDGEVKTACQVACPAEAIVFGDLNDPNSAVARLKDHPLDYSMLGQLNTRPRTTYLAKIQNPNPEM
jgi:molybdopterin-containing oxidoreductase family iron-sulfur binding subunit